MTIAPLSESGSSLEQYKRLRTTDLRRPRDEREPRIHPPGVYRSPETGEPTRNRCIEDADVLAPLMWDRDDFVARLRKAGAL